MPNRPAEQVYPITVSELVRCFFEAIAETQSLPMNLAWSTLSPIIKEHRRSCSRKTGDVYEIAADLIDQLAGTSVTTGGWEPSAFIGKALDAYASCNSLYVDWEDADATEGFNSMIDLACSGRATRAQFVRWAKSVLVPLEDDGTWGWSATRDEHPEPLTLHAIILGPMTDVDHEQAKTTRALACAIRIELEGHGFTVHAPCADEALARDTQTIANEDRRELARSNLVVVLTHPPALGVGMLLGLSTRTNPVILALTELCTEVTPLAAILGGVSSETYSTVSDAVEKVRRTATRRASEILAHAALLRHRREEHGAQFREYEREYRKSSHLTSFDPMFDSAARLMCTELDVFLTATHWELTHIADAFNTGEPDCAESTPNPEAKEIYEFQDNKPADTHEKNGDLDPRELHAVELGEHGAPDTHVIDREYSLFDLPNEPVSPVKFLSRPPGWDSTEWLLGHEIEAALILTQAIGLTKDDLKEMLDAGRGRRYDESRMAAISRSKQPLGSAPEWRAFWYDFMGKK